MHSRLMDWFRVLSLILLSFVFTGNAAKYDGYKLLRFEANKTIADWLDEMSDKAHHFDEKHGGEQRILIDVFSEPSKKQSHADVAVAPEFIDAFLILLKEHGVQTVTVLKENVQALIDEEERAIEKRRRRRKRSINPIDNFDDANYNDYEEMLKFILEAEQAFPEIAKVINVSTSTEKRPILGLKLSTSTSYKPAIIIDAGVHAREWIAPAVAMYIMKKLVTSYGQDARITRALHDWDWFIVPQMNPDGYVYSRTTDRLWRKTRTRYNFSRYCLGADANRNWGYKWGESGANRSPCSNIYQGPHPFSEPEVAGLKNFITFEIPNPTIYISLHAYGQVWLSPWGWTSDRPNSFTDQKEAAAKAAEAIRKYSGSKYTYGTIAEVMYPASGTSIDYLYDKGVPYIYGVELRPADPTDNYGFNIPPFHIRPTGDEMLEGILAVCDHALHKRRGS